MNKTSKPKYDCLKCPGYCCSHPRIAVSEYDIARLAKHFDLSVTKARKKFTYTYKDADTEEVILRHQKDTVYKTICQFFDRDERRCTVYQARPNVCRKYPYGTQCGYYDFLKFEREHQADDDYVATTR